MKDWVLLLPAVVVVVMFGAGWVTANPLVLFLSMPSALVCGGVLAVIDAYHRES